MSSRASRLLLALVLFALFALVGPRLALPEGRKAGAPFEYVPPVGFALDTNDGGKTLSGSVEGLRKTFRYMGPGSSSFKPVVAWNLVPDRGTVEPEDMARVARGMPALFAPQGEEWTLVRTFTRERPDHARVGGIVGAVTRKDNVAYQIMQLAFPVDEGTALVTAKYPVTEAGAWGPVFEGTIDNAKGVALRPQEPEAGTRIMFGAPGALLGLALAWLLGARKMAPSAKPARRGDDA